MARCELYPASVSSAARRVLPYLVEQTVETITNAARTERIGDGKIFVVDLSHVVRIRTGETGTEAR